MQLSHFLKPYVLPVIAGGALVGNLAYIQIEKAVQSKPTEADSYETVEVVYAAAPQEEEVVPEYAFTTYAEAYKKVEEVEEVQAEPEPQSVTVTMNVTAYTAGPESTGKHKGHPEYGITASGAYVEQGRTIAAGPSVPFGTKIYIPYFDGKPGFGDGVFIVEDRGGAIKDKNIDVYFDDLSEALEFGRHDLEVIILED